eukprot:gene10381-biopygen7566
MKRHGKGSALEHLQLHRTKCSKLISKVISPALHENLKDAVRDKKYSVLIDESTDVSSEKNLCVAVRYFDEARGTIATDYAGLISVCGAKGSELFAHLKTTLEEMGMSLSNCIGFGSDGASAMIGQHDSVWSRIKADSPDCQLNRCICHSLALCIEKAFEKMPSNLGYLLAEIPKWFHKSKIRREAFKDLFNTMDPNEERKGMPLPFQKTSAIRWLVRGKVIYHLLVNWEELKAYFSCVIPTADASCRYKAREILGMLNDQVNLLYFHFVSPLVTEFERVNSLFQATDVEGEEMEKELTLHYKSLKARMYNEHGELLPANKIEFGAKFISELIKFENSDTRGKVMEVRQRCADMLAEALVQVEKRLPQSKAIFKGLSSLSTNKVLSQTSRVAFADLPMPHLRDINQRKTKEQYRKIMHVDWKEEAVFGGSIPSETVEFWSKILQHQTSSGSVPFKELAMYALSCLATPVTNAVVERVFSVVTAVKTKLRNRLSTEMLDGIIRIRTRLHFQGKCCRDFVVTLNMLARFNSERMYTTTNLETPINEDENTTNDDELMILSCI